MTIKRTIYDGDTIEVDGRSFTVTFPTDDFGRKPWEDGDGVGIVSDWIRSTRRGKAPGERILHTDDHYRRYYDFGATLQKAKRDGWGLTEADTTKLTAKLGRAPSKAEIAVEAVEHDFERMRQWCNDQWRYVGVVVTDDETGAQDSLWGVESDCDEYLAETARELAQGLQSQHATALACEIAASRPDLAPNHAG